MGITSGGVSLLRFASLAVVLSAVHPWIPLILVLALIPHEVLERRLSEARVKGTVALAPERRKIDYTQGLLFDPVAAKEVKLFGLAPYLFDLYKSLFDAAFRRQSAIHRRQTLLAVAGSLLSLAGLSATAVLTMQQFRNGAVSAGSLVMAFRAVQSMPAYAGGVVRSWGMALENSMYMGRLRRLVSTVGETSASHGALELEAPLKTIELSAVSFRYPGADRLALGGVNLTLRRGESVALVGLNGAGKTTLAKLLLGLYRPSEGQILYDGRSVSEYDLGSLRRRMGCLFQDFVKYLLTVRDNVAFGAESEPEDCVIQRAIEQAGATDLVQSAGGLDAQLGKQFGGTDLSGGEWQKLALARALIRDVDFLVLDEPSASLDADAEYELYVRFKEMAGDRICLLISHRFTTVSIADRIVVLSDGRIVEEGSHSELMDRAGVYARMYRMQAEQYWKEQADRHASGQAGKHVDRSADKHANGPAGKYADRPADKHANGPAGENSRTHVGQRSKEGGSG